MTSIRPSLSGSTGLFPGSGRLWLGWPLYRIFLVLLSVLLVVGCGPASHRDDTPGARRNERPSEGPGEREGERKKSWTGLSYARQTQVRVSPGRSMRSNGFDAERAWSGQDDWEPAVAADPGSAYVYQLTTRFGSGASRVIFRRSPDGGATWEADQVLARLAGDPMIEVTDAGTIHAVALVGNDWRIELSRSFDQGDSWTDPLNVLGEQGQDWGDRPVLLVSPDGQEVYVAFNQSDSYVAASTDGGESFFVPVQTSSDSRYWFHSAGAMAPNGDIYFAAASYSWGYSGDVELSVLRSEDAGESWTTTPIDTSAEVGDCDWVPGCYFGFLGPSMGLAIDVDGLVMIAYNAGSVPGEAQSLWVRTSLDGVNWSERQAISSGAPGVRNGFPAIVASRSVPGDFRVVWQDDRELPESGWNTWIRRSVDGGSSWFAAERLSDLGSGAPYKSESGYAFVYGDYLEAAIDGQDVNHVIWGEATSYNGPGGSWYTRGQTVPEPSSPQMLLWAIVTLAVLIRCRAQPGGRGCRA